MNTDLRTIIFAAILGLACSVVLVGVTRFTAPYREANAKAEEVRNLLSALNVAADLESDAEALTDIYNRDVRIREEGDLTYYDYVPGGTGAAVAVGVFFTGMGLWGPIGGVLALEPNLRTIRGIRFYQQEETPGLGGEIGAAWFRDQFVGKQIVSSTGQPGFKILKPGSAADDNAVDGISGATMTSDKVQAILDALAKRLQGGQ